MVGGVWRDAVIRATIAVCVGGACGLCLADAADAAGNASEAGEATWRLVSMPDFLNVDTCYPEPLWEDALTYVLGKVKAERGDYLLVAGDLLMGRWWDSAGQIEHLGNLYYGAWQRRMQAHGLPFLAAIGDHEIGDNPWPPRKAKLVPAFKKAFRDHLKMPRNGPGGMEGTAWWLVHKGVLIVAVDVFTPDEKVGIQPTVRGEQLAWLEKVLSEQGPKVHHIIVMGHTPILGPVRARASSRIMLEGGRTSALWQTMAKHKVDLYLCGEVHDITCKHADGVEQISHGSLFGYVNSANYMTIEISPKQIRLELKSIPIVCEGGKMYQEGQNRPQRIVRITDEAKKAGFRTVGSAVLDKSGEAPVWRERTGLFAERYEGPSRRRRGPAKPQAAGRPREDKP